MVNFAKHEKINVTMHLRIVRFSIWAGCLVLVAWLINLNLAITGNYQVSIDTFSHLPRSIQYVDGANIELVNTFHGIQTKLNKDTIKFAVTLPRGFDTVTMNAVVAADPYATVILGAQAPTSAPIHTASFHFPSSYGSEWREISLGNGLLHVKNRTFVQDVDAFWKNFSKLKSIYSIGDGLMSFIPSNLYEKYVNVKTVQLPGGYRGSFTVSAYFNGKPQQVVFDTQVVYNAPGKNTLRVTIEHLGETVLTKDVLDLGHSNQHVTLDLPASSQGFYTIRFVPSTEARVVRNVQLQGDAVQLSKSLFLDQSLTPVTLFTACENLTLEAVHDLGTQNPVEVNGVLVHLLDVKKPQKVKVSRGTTKLTFPHGDVSVSNSCGFTIQPVNELQNALRKLSNHIIVVPQLTAATVNGADFIYDPIPIAHEVRAKQNMYEVEKTFDLHTLSAKGKTFTFTLSEPGLTTQPDAFLYIKKITFFAKRSPFSINDLKKILGN